MKTQRLKMDLLYPNVCSLLLTTSVLNEWWGWATTSIWKLELAGVCGSRGLKTGCSGSTWHQPHANCSPGLFAKVPQEAFLCVMCVGMRPSAVSLTGLCNTQGPAQPFTSFSPYIWSRYQVGPCWRLQFINRNGPATWLCEWRCLLPSLTGCLQSLRSIDPCNSNFHMGVPILPHTKQMNK